VPLRKFGLVVLAAVAVLTGCGGDPGTQSGSGAPHADAGNVPSAPTAGGVECPVDRCVSKDGVTAAVEDVRVEPVNDAPGPDRQDYPQFYFVWTIKNDSPETLTIDESAFGYYASANERAVLPPGVSGQGLDCRQPTDGIRIPSGQRYRSPEPVCIYLPDDPKALPPALVDLGEDLLIPLPGE
jgi:hypothetical protein